MMRSHADYFFFFFFPPLWNSGCYRELSSLLASCGLQQYSQNSIKSSRCPYYVAACLTHRQGREGLQRADTNGRALLAARRASIYKAGNIYKHAASRLAVDAALLHTSHQSAGGSLVVEAADPVSSARPTNSNNKCEVGVGTHVVLRSSSFPFFSCFLSFFSLPSRNAWFSSTLLNLMRVQPDRAKHEHSLALRWFTLVATEFTFLHILLSNIYRFSYLESFSSPHGFLPTQHHYIYSGVHAGGKYTMAPRHIAFFFFCYNIYLPSWCYS